MRHPRIIIAGIGLAAIAAVGGATAAADAGPPASGTAPAASAPAARPPAPAPAAGPGATATVHTALATVGGRTQAILVNGHGLPLYYYRPDTATRSLVSGGLARLWPPLTSAAPTGASGVTGKLTVVHDAHGDQVGYKGHLLYTFAGDWAWPGDRPGLPELLRGHRRPRHYAGHVLGTRHNGPGRPAQRLRVLKVRHALGTANWPMTATSTLPPVTSRVPVAGHFGPPIRVRLPAGGWQVGFRGPAGRPHRRGSD